MESRLQRLKELEEEREQKLKNLRVGRLLVAFALLAFASFSILTIISTIEQKDSAQTKTDVESAFLTDAEKASWELILVNDKNPLSRAFTVDLIAFEDTRVDYRISEPLQKMIDAAKTDGINLSACSAFRSVTEQDELYNTKYLAYVNAGYSDKASEILASQYVQAGGTSEHHTGLAVDLITDGTTVLDEGFADTPAYSWLKENAAKYGFIERYPEDKSQMTGIQWEPWHYRYVGESNAEKMVAQNLCLEEYLQNTISES